MVSRVAKNLFYGESFYRVVHPRTRPVGVDVADVGRIQFSFGNGDTHGGNAAVGIIWFVGDAKRIARTTETTQFRQRNAAPFAAMFGVFQDKKRRPFAQHKAIAVAVERTTCAPVIIVVFGQNTQQTKRQHIAWIGHRVATTCHHHIALPVFYFVKGFANGLTRRCASRCQGLAVALNVVLDRQMGRNEVRNGFDGHQWVRIVH